MVVAIECILSKIIMSLRTIFCCMKNCFDGTGFSFRNPEIHEQCYPIVLDPTGIGSEIVLLKNNNRICGKGGGLCSAPLVQSKSYFEVKIQQSGIWGVGVATREADLGEAPGGSDSESWVFCSDGSIRHNGSNIYSNLDILEEGDSMGISYDHIVLQFYLNGKCIGKEVSGIRGTVYPVIFVDEGAVLDLVVEEFQNTLPTGFEKIMIEKSLL